VCVCVCVCLDINLDEINAWQKTVISLDKMQPIVLKITDVHRQQPTVTSYVKRHKRNSSNKFELRDGIVFKIVFIPPVPPECSTPLILKSETGQEPGPAPATCHCHFHILQVNISNQLTVLANTFDSPMLKQNHPSYPKFLMTLPTAANMKACRWIRS